MSTTSNRSGEFRWIQIYLLRFTDGTRYVGQTVQPLEHRIRQHGDYRTTGSGGLVERIREGLLMEAVVLSCHRKQAAADRAEAAAIRRESRRYGPGSSVAVINRGGNIVRLPSEPAARRDGKYPRRESPAVVCSWCRRSQPSSVYRSDRSRSSGLGSRCRECENVRLKARRNDSDAGAAYVAAKRICQGEAAAGRPMSLNRPPPGPL